jgi:hypothetical protein
MDALMASQASQDSTSVRSGQQVISVLPLARSRLISTNLVRTQTTFENRGTTLNGSASTSVFHIFILDMQYTLSVHTEDDRLGEQLPESKNASENK